MVLKDQVAAFFELTIRTVESYLENYRPGTPPKRLGVCRTEFIVWAMSLASAARAAQWQGGSLAKNARGGLKNGRRSGEEGVFLKEASEFARFCSV